MRDNEVLGKRSLDPDHMLFALWQKSIEIG
jgi:hypothetical protein